MGGGMEGCGGIGDERRGGWLGLLCGVDREPVGVKVAEKRTNSNLHSNGPYVCPCMKL